MQTIDFGLASNLAPTFSNRQYQDVTGLATPFHISLISTLIPGTQPGGNSADVDKPIIQPESLDPSLTSDSCFAQNRRMRSEIAQT